MENTKNTITIKHGAAAPTVNDLSLYEFGYSSNKDDIYLKVDKGGTIVLRSEKEIINQLIESSLAPIDQQIDIIKSDITSINQSFTSIGQQLDTINLDLTSIDRNINTVKTDLNNINSNLSNWIAGVENTFATGFTLNNAVSDGSSTTGKILAKDSNGTARDLIYRNSNNAVVVGDQQSGSTAGSLFLGVGSDKNAIVVRPDGTNGTMVNYPVYDSKNVKELLFKALWVPKEDANGNIEKDDKGNIVYHWNPTWVRRNSKYLGSDKLKYNYYLARIEGSDSFVLLTKTETNIEINGAIYDYKLQGMNIKFQDSFATGGATATYNDPYIELVQIFVRSSNGRFFYADGRRYKLSTSGITLEYGGSSSAKILEELWGIL